MLKLLFDEHISPSVARGLRHNDASIVVHAMTEWQDGSLLGREDEFCLREAAAHKLTLATYDRRTIPPLLKSWTEQGRSHAGVIFVDDKTIAPSNIGGLVSALGSLARESKHWHWTGRVCFLQR